MNELRKHGLIEQILADLADVNVGPGHYVPVLMLQRRAMKRVVGGEEFGEALNAMLTTEPALLKHQSGGTPGGRVALTDEGYRRSREL